MRILAVDTSTRAGGVAVLEDRRLLGHSFTHSADEFSTRFFNELDQLLRGLILKLPDFDLFAVVAGPGSFTGLRIGLTAVKAWAEVYGKPIAAVSGLEALASQVSAADAELIAPILDARRGQVFGTLFRREANRLHRVGDDFLMRPDELLKEVATRATGKRVRLVSPTPELMGDAINSTGNSGISIERVSADLTPWVGQLAFDCADRGDFVDALALDADYLRRCDAEAYWQDV